MSYIFECLIAFASSSMFIYFLAWRLNNDLWRFSPYMIGAKKFKTLNLDFAIAILKIENKIQNRFTNPLRLIINYISKF